MALSKNVVAEPFWAIQERDVLDILETRELGLSEKEVLLRRALFGANVITESARFSGVKVFLKQFKSPLIFILVLAGIITLFLREWVNTGVIFAAVLLNVSLGFYQENKAETALELLRSYIRTRTRVRYRAGEREIDASELVPGDIIRVSQGDRVPADARILFANALEVDETVLTGESLPVLKLPDPVAVETILAERASMIFSGTLIVQGFADAVVVATGDATEFGKIATLVKEKEREATPLERAMARFVTESGLILGVLICALFFVGVLSGYQLFEMFLIGVAVAVSAVPEGLPIALTVILAMGVQRLAAKKGIVRRLLAAETLGSTSLILTDKTGTLTQAKMEIAAIIPLGRETEAHVLRNALLNTDVLIENPEESPDKWVMSGKPLEVALVRGAAERGVLLREQLRYYTLADRLPFDSTHKFSVSLSHASDQGHVVMLGAPDIILKYTNIGTAEKERIIGLINERAARGERVLGVAGRKTPREHKKLSKEIHLADLEFCGLISFKDPLRPTVASAIRRIAEAGVRTVILTGDHKGTAETIARELGMIDGRGAVLTGDELNHLTKEELMNRASEICVYARVTPEQKVQITKLYREKGEIVAVTGDGVNDAPALQVADIGIAVGSGTDVAKGAADLIILDDNFETIVSAIEEGRTILDNIRKVIVYLLSDALDELLLIGGALLMGIALPLNALQILFVNFFSDSFPAIGFAFEKGVDSLGTRPRKLHKNLFDKEVRFLIIVIGAATSTLLFILYYSLLRLGHNPELVRSFIFATFATYSLLVVFSLRSLRKSIFEYNPFSNHYLVGGVFFGIVLTACALYIPVLQKVFDTVALPPLWVAAVVGVGIVNIVLVEFGKWIFRIQLIKG